MRMACGEELASLGKLAPPPREWGELRRAHHPALPRCYAAGIRLALEVENLGISCGFLVHFPGSFRFTFFRGEAREKGFTAERTGGTFSRRLAQKTSTF